MSFSGIVYRYTSPSGKVYVGQTTNEKMRRTHWFHLRSDYGGVRVASRSSGCSPSCIRACCNGISSVSKGFQWCDLDGVGHIRDLSATFSVNHKTSKVRIPRQQVFVYKFDLYGNLVGEFVGVTDASRLLGISRALLSRCLSGKRLFAGGFRWSLRSDGSDLRPLTSEEFSLASLSDAELSSWYRSKSHIGLVISPETRRKLSESNKGKKRSASTRALISELVKSRCSSRSYRLGLCKAHGVSGVFQYDLDGVLVAKYACISDAIAATGLSRGSIQASAQGNRLSGGLFQWRYVGSDLPVGPISLSDRVKHRLVDILEYDLDGVLVARHPSVLAAAGGDLRHVRKEITACCDGLRDSYRGRQWRYEGSPLVVKSGVNRSSSLSRAGIVQLYIR